MNEFKIKDRVLLEGTVINIKKGTPYPIEVQFSDASTCLFNEKDLRKIEDTKSFETDTNVYCKRDLISRSALIKNMNDTGVHIILDLPVEEVLGESVDIDDFTMLLQDAIQAYRKMIIDTIQKQQACKVPDYGALTALLGIDEEIKTIVSELKRKGFEEPEGFSTLRGYIDDRIKELE